MGKVFNKVFMLKIVLNAKIKKYFMQREKKYFLLSINAGDHFLDCIKFGIKCGVLLEMP